MPAHPKTRSGSLFAVKQVRGPFLELPPHHGHTASDKELGALCTDLRAHDVPLAADLFSGAGGMSLGLEEAGFRVVLGVDHYRFAVETHRHHFAGMSVEADLADPATIIHIAKLLKRNKVAILAGGPPCQPFSRAGRSMLRHRVLTGAADPHDERRDLWRSFLEVVQLARPQAVVMENVPDMALDREMFILRSMTEELEQIGYSVSARVIDSWRFGVPQMRQRLLLVALRNRVRFTWPAESAKRVTLWNAIGDMPEVQGGWRPDGGAFGWADYHGPRTEYQRWMRRNVSEEDADKLFDHITRPVREDDRAAFESMTHKTKYTDLAPELQRYRKDIFDDKYKKLDENDLSRTITAHIAKDGYWYIHPRQPRTLTVREAARIQTFPDDFRFAGPPSAAFKQIGNAVPPLIGRVIGEAVWSSVASGVQAVISTRETAAKLARWFRGRRPPEAMPWLKTNDRWKFLLGELLLDRATPTVTSSVWPVIESQPDLAVGGLPDAAVVDLLDELMSGVGRGQRILVVRQLLEQMTAAPAALWQPTIDRAALPAIPAALCDLVELALPATVGKKESEEPVLITKGVLRVASRFQGNDADKRNVQTDGRIAVAGMIGFGDASRPAHLGLIALAAEVCLVDKPLCGECPLSRWCMTAGG
ncbi:Modification methylase HaeIII [Mycobacterium talmoniae]|uniref:DNA (cytosine-5-)-methyltransferase n=1 Tax=Mycobacterium talmoniae TaxID=1858794 RepID=A0A2S8BGM7_9MYCO|nr:DNA cytosine methyltransferase [Mycobacterium eburneum]PQM45822.1 Modification methylase HaeIII [Mycobacterium talmoniae]TDH45799.1 DNA cytosine methyltransferase [Mycobacterium eburneum]